MDEKRNVQAWTSTYPALETFLLSARSTLSQLWHVGTKAATAFSFCPFDFKLFPILILILCISRLGISLRFYQKQQQLLWINIHFSRDVTHVIKRPDRDLCSFTHTHYRLILQLRFDIVTSEQNLWFSI